MYNVGMNKIVTVLAIVVALIVGGAVGYLSAGSQYSALLAKDAAMLDKAKLAFPTPPTMLSLSGTIKSISGNTLTIESSASGNPFDDLPTIRQVTLTGATKIVSSKLKDLQIFSQEMSDYQKAIQKAAPGVGSTTTPVAVGFSTPPVPFSETEMQISDLKAGDVITVEAGKDIKMATSFDAVKVTLSVVP